MLQYHESTNGPAEREKQHVLFDSRGEMGHSKKVLTNYFAMDTVDLFDSINKQVGPIFYNRHVCFYKMKMLSLKVSGSKSIERWPWVICL